MNVQITFKHMQNKPDIKAYAEEKSEKLKKYFNGKVHLTWTFDHLAEGMVAHCHLVGNHIDFFGEATTEDLRASIDGTIDKIERQIRKKKEIVKDHLHKHAS